MKLDARRTWIELLNLDPSHGPALNNLANLMSAAGENEEARSIYARGGCEASQRSDESRQLMRSC